MSEQFLNSILAITIVLCCRAVLGKLILTISYNKRSLNRKIKTVISNHKFFARLLATNA